jgi:hypothetical protein
MDSWPPSYAGIRAALFRELYLDAAATGPLEWPALLRIADWHRLSTVVARELEAPRPYSQALAQAALADTARAMLIERDRSAALRALSDAEIPVIVLKGSALVETVFTEPGTRDSSDIDLLVPGDRMRGATEALGRLGYRTYDPGAADDEKRHEPKLVSDNGLIPVELHRRPLDSVDHSRFDVAEIWRRAQPSAAGTHLLPAPADLLIHLCLHFLQGRDIRSEGALGQVRDIATVAERGGVDWSELWDTSRRFGVDERMRLVLASVSELGLTRTMPPPTFPRRRVRAFIRARVLTHEPHPPLGAWPPRHWLRDGSWWSRIHLGDIAAGTLPDRGEDILAAVPGQSTALWRLVRAVAREPRLAATDLASGRWLRKLDR